MKRTLTLKAEVVEILENMVDIDYPIQRVVTDILDHGCASGIVSDLIYYHQTESFFDRHKDEINQLAQNISIEIYGNPYRIYEELADCSKNGLTWLAFEQTVSSVACDLDLI